MKPNSGYVQDYRTGVVLVLLGGVASSSIGMFVRAIESATTWQILFYRSLTLLVFLWSVLAYRNGGAWAIFNGFGPATVLGAIGLTTAFCGIIGALQMVSVANAMFLLAVAPFLAAVLGWLVLRERVNGSTWLAISAAFLGVGIMVVDGLSVGQWWGNLVAMLAALGYAMFAVALRWGRQSDMLPCTVFAAFLGSMVAAGVCLLDGSGLILTACDGMLAIAMGVFQLGLALLLITAGSRTVPAAEIPLIGMSEVLLAPLWVWLFLGETAGFFTLVGGAVLLIAIGGDTLCGIRRERRAIAASAR